VDSNVAQYCEQHAVHEIDNRYNVIFFSDMRTESPESVWTVTNNEFTCCADHVTRNEYVLMFKSPNSSSCACISSLGPSRGFCVDNTFERGTGPELLSVSRQ